MTAGPDHDRAERARSREAARADRAQEAQPPAGRRARPPGRRRHARRRARRADLERRGVDAAGARPGRPRARSSATARGWPPSRRRRGCARSSRPTATATARWRPRARRRPAAPRGSRWRPRTRRRSCASAGIDGPLLVMGALSRAGARPRARGARRRRRLARGVRSRGCRTTRRRARQARHGDGPARARATPTRPRAWSRGCRRPRSPALMTHFATADEDDPAFLGEQLDRFERLAMRARHPRRARARRQLRGHAARARARFDMVRCGIAIYGMDPFHRDPADARPRAGARAALSYVAEVKRARAGRERRLRPPLRGRARDLARHASRSATATACGAALTNNADVLVDGRRVPLVGTVSMDNITVDLGDEPVGARRRGRPDRRPGRRADPRRGARRSGSARSTTRSPVASPLACRGSTRGERPRRTARSAAAAPLEAAREALAGREAWLVGGAVRDRLLGRATDDVDVALDGRPARGGAQRSPAPPAAPRSSCPARSAPGASSAPATPGTSTS